MWRELKQDAKLQQNRFKILSLKFLILLLPSAHSGSEEIVISLHTSHYFSVLLHAAGWGGRSSHRNSWIQILAWKKGGAKCSGSCVWNSPWPTEGHVSSFCHELKHGLILVKAFLIPFLAETPTAGLAGSFSTSAFHLGFPKVSHRSQGCRNFAEEPSQLKSFTPETWGLPAP